MFNLWNRLARCAAAAGNTRSLALKLALAFKESEAGATVVAVALAMPVLTGAMGLAAEVSYWHLHHRAMQNAADSAAIAAATNNTSSYVAEAQAVAAQYGFRNGVDNVTVTVTQSNSAAGCTSNCYSVAISDVVPLYLSQAVGFAGNATMRAASVGSSSIAQSTTPGMAIGASAAAHASPNYSYCILALASDGVTGIRTNGAPNSNIGCNMMSDTTADCNGHNLGAPIGDAQGTNDGCGVVANSSKPVVADTYAVLAANIPSNTCGSYPQKPVTNSGPPLPSSNRWHGAKTINGNLIVCGDLQLTGNTTISSTSGAVIVIENGQLDTNGYTLQGTSAAGMTIVFTGANNSTYQHIPTGGGGLDIAAPTSGAWSGVALYIDPALTTNVDISAAGNSPTWNISGLVYLPHSSVTLSGMAGQSTMGARCLVLVVNDITINGTGAFFANDTQCPTSGLIMPAGSFRGTLVN